MRLLSFVLYAILMLSFSVPALSADKTSDIYIFAGASTTDVLNDAISLYIEKNKSAMVKASYGGSGALAKQVFAGAPADIFLSANYEWMKYLEDKDMVVKSSVKEIAKGRLVLISKKDNNTAMVTINNLANYLKQHKGKIAIGDPKSVPAGSYSMQVFNNLKIFDDIKPYIIYSNSVRTALNYVKRGEVEFALVYYVDTYTDKDKFNIYFIDEKLHEPITYWSAIIKGKDTDAVKKLYAFLFSDSVKSIFKKYGY